MARYAKLRETLSETLWVAPVLGLVLAMALVVVTIQADLNLGVGSSPVIGFGGDADSARSILSTIAASMLTFLALVFTLTVVALQLASDYSPRLLRNFLTARSSKLALALFVATFTYSVLVLREVSTEQVPELSVTVALLLVILSALAFVYYVGEIANSLRVARIVQTAGDLTRTEISSSFGRAGAGGEDEERARGWRAIEAREPDELVAWEGTAGAVTALDLGGFRRLAESKGLIFELRMQPGDFLPAGAPAVAIYGPGSGLGASEVGKFTATAAERSINQDAAFGIRQLVDIAVRGLSPGINDPTTASQAIDQIHDVLLRLGSSRLHSGVLRDDTGDVRVLLPVHSWPDYLHLALDEIRIYGEGSPQVSRRLRSMLLDLRDRLPQCRREALDAQLELLERSIDSAFANAADREWIRRSPAAGAAAIRGA